MIEIIKSETFERWFNALRDRHAQTRIDMRIRRMSAGNPGQVREVGRGVSEMKVDVGPGYRVYYVRRGAAVVILLCGGDKGSQQRDIALAHVLAEDWK